MQWDWNHRAQRKQSYSYLGHYWSISPLYPDSLLCLSQKQDANPESKRRFCHQEPGLRGILQYSAGFSLQALMSAARHMTVRPSQIIGFIAQAVASADEAGSVFQSHKRQLAGKFAHVELMQTATCDKRMAMLTVKWNKRNDSSIF